MEVSTLPKITPEMVKQIQQLEGQKTSLEKEVEFLRQKEIHLQKEVDKTGQDVFSKDMAMVLKRYYEMEEQFGQMKKEIKQDVKNVLAKKEKKIVQQVQGHLVETEKRMQGNFVDNVKKMQEHVEKRLGETEDHFKQQSAGRVIENEKQIQQKVKESIVEHGQKIRKQLDKCLEDNEKKMQEHEKEVKQQVNQRIEENEKKMKEQTDIILTSDSLMKEATHKAVDAHTIVLGETVNEQGYFTTMIPMKRLPDNMVQITGAYGGGCLYVELDKIKTYDDFKNLIRSVWGLDLKLVGNSSYLIDGWASYFDVNWPGPYLKFKRIIITPYYNCPEEHLVNCTT
ncbi:Protein of unknown function [Pyronema omphalodes CBS 100304]|uniref:Uncharacterized protein n=1 Tax=Pyronema omphalodes (strain CBS 100304) TaxID=1076935 RepID=U4L2K5_PYROM|nr:Protein of unknown function [Pyronema omphalodes CBS 100304]